MEISEKPSFCKNRKGIQNVGKPYTRVVIQHRGFKAILFLKGYALPVIQETLVQ